MKISIKNLFVLTGVTVSLVGCNKKESASTESARSSVVLETPLQATLATFDPAKVYDLYTHRVLLQVFEGLVSLGEDNTPKPALAEKYERSADGKVYTFHIRKNVKFHNGDALTAEDVKWSFNRTCHPKVNSSNATQFFADIVGAEEVITGKQKEISGVKVVDTHTLQVTIKKPNPIFLAKLAYPTCYVYPKEKVPFAEITDKSKVIGTGPYKFSEYHKDQLVVLDANKDYWGGVPKNEKIKFHIVKDQLIALSSFKSGKYNFMLAPTTEVPSLRKDARFNKQLQFKDHASAYYLEFCPKNYKPFANAKVRQAFAMAIDAKPIVDQILSGVGVVANGIVPPGIPGHRENTGKLSYDPVKAKKLLAEAGYADPKKLPRLELVTSAKQPANVPVTENVVLQLQKNLGINITVKQMDFTSYVQKREQGKLAFYFAGWSADYFDCANFLSDLYKTGVGTNHIGYSNAKFDALVNKADVMDNPDQHEMRIKLYNQAEDVLLQDAPMIPIYYPKDIWLIRDNVEGLKFNLSGPMALNTVSLK